jgi:hypothetical protein
MASKSAIASRAPRESPGCRLTRKVEGFFDEHRYALQQLPFATGQTCIRVCGRRERPLEVAHDHRIDRAVVRLDAIDQMRHDLQGG